MVIFDHPASSTEKSLNFRQKTLKTNPQIPQYTIHITQYSIRTVILMQLWPLTSHGDKARSRLTINGWLNHKWAA
jgi:hypothetical protein